MSKYISGIKSTSFSLDINGIVSTTNIPGATSIPGVSIGLNSLTTAAMELTSTGTASYIDFTKLNVDYGGRMLYDHTANEMQIFTNLATTAEVFINNTGNMGIGARSVTYKLETTGDIMARNSFLRTTGNTGMFNDTYGSGWYMTDTTAMRVINDKHIATAGNIYVTNVNPTGVINLLNDQSIYFQTNSTQNRIHYDSTNAILAFDTNAVHKFFTNTALQMTINTNNVTLPNGNTLFTTNIDSVTQNVAVGFYTTKPTQSVPIFNVYNNNTDKLVLFAVNTVGINGGANNVVVTPQLLVNNALVVANNTGIENLLQNMSTTTGAPVNLLMPNLSAGNYTLFRLGSAVNTYNSAELRFSYTSSGNLTNSFGIGFYGVNPLYAVTAGGAHTFVGNNALFSIPVAITNALSVTNASAVENTIQNLTTISASALNLLMPNLASNNFHTFRMGATTKQNNCAEFRFTLASTGSTANSLGLAFFGTNNLYTLTVSGIHTFVGSNALFSIPVVITSTLNSAALTCTTINTQGNTINSGQINATLINATTAHVNSVVTPFAQGAYFLWNRSNGSGTATLANQQGSGSGGFEFINYDSNNILLPGRFILDTSGSGTFTNIMNSASIITGVISSAAINTNANSITCGPISSAAINTNNSNIVSGTGTVTTNYLYCNGLTSQGNPINTGTVNCTNISSTFINTNGSSITAGPIMAGPITTANIDSASGNVAIGYATVKQTGAVPTFNVYNNSTDRVVLFAVNTAGTTGGANNVVVTPPLFVNNALLVTNSTTVENTIQNTATAAGVTLNLMMPNLSTGSNVYFRNGISVSSRNAFELSFNYVGSGNTANSIGIGFVGIAPLYRVNTIGVHLFAGNSATFSIPIIGNNGLFIPGNYPITSQGISIQWNRTNGTGAASFINQQGGGGGGFEFLNFNSSNVQLAGKFTLDTSGSGIFTGAMNSASIVTGNISSASINTNGSGITAGPITTANIDSAGGNVAIGYTTVKQTGAVPTFNVYNNSTDHVVLFAANTAGTTSGANNVQVNVPLITTSINTNGNSITAGNISVSGFSAPTSQGASLQWNRYGSGTAVLANQQGGGSGGFEFLNFNSSNVQLAGKFTLDTSGSGIFTGAMNSASIVTGNISSASISASNLYTTGSVGIGNSSPQYTLDVSGNILARNAFLRTTGNTGLYNDTYGGGWYMTDTSAVRVYGDKNIATAGSLFATAGNFTGALNASNLYTTGSVGIGNSNPGYALDVTGDILARNAFLRTTGNTGFYNNTYNGGWYMTDTSAVRVYADKNIATAGSLFVNTGNFSGNVNANDVHVNGFNTPTTQGAIFGWNRDGARGLMCFANQQGSGIGGFEFLNYDSNNALLPGSFTMDNSGNGTFTGTMNATSVVCNGLTTNGNTLNCGGINANYLSIANGYINVSNASSAGSGLIQAFSPNLSTGSNSVIRIGINGGTYNAAEIRFSNYGGLGSSSNGLGFSFDGFAPLYEIIANGGHIFTGSSATFQIPVNINNYLYSNTFAYFNGNVNLSNQAVNGYCNSPGPIGSTNSTSNTAMCAQFFGSVLFSNGWYVNSDRRIKKDIVYVSNEHDILLALKPCTYTNLDFTKDNGRKHGLIAQEVEAVFPDAITNGTDAIPNIMKLVTYVSDRSFTTTVELQLGKIRLHVSDIIVEGIENKENIESMLDCEIIEKVGNVYTVDKDLKKIIFVYGEFIDDFKSIEYNTFVPLLIAGYQSQETRIKQLEAQVQILINKLT